jgi:hypothetical protein
VTTIEQHPPAAGQTWWQDLVPTERIDVGEQTRVMRPFLAEAPISPLPRYETGQQTLPPREGVFLPDATVELMPPLPGEPTPPTSPAPAPVPAPGPRWAAPAAVYPPVRPAPLERVAGPDETAVVKLLGADESPRQRRSQPYRKPDGWVRTRRHSRPTPVWAWALVNAAISVTFGAVGGGLVLALAVLEVAR